MPPESASKMLLRSQVSLGLYVSTGFCNQKACSNLGESCRGSVLRKEREVKKLFLSPILCTQYIHTLFYRPVDSGRRKK